MNPAAFRDVAAPATKAVFVHMTAGDAGLGTGAGRGSHPYYLARDNGAEEAVRFMADADTAPADKIAVYMTFNGHPIYRVSYRNTVSYFLRVPDGSMSGAGYPDTGHQSLLRLARGDIDTLSAIDGSTDFHGWTDLVATLRAILEFEREKAPTVQVNVAEPNERINPGDHPDHLMTAKAALDAAAGLGCARRVYYVDYASAQLPENLDTRERDLQSSVFAVTAAGVRALGHNMNWRRYDHAYVGRNYYRVEHGTGHCDLAPAGLPVAAGKARADRGGLSSSAAARGTRTIATAPPSEASDIR
jgi:hypothetical protein